jgi:hypothetical protein
LAPPEALELITRRQIVAYPSDDLRRAMSKTIAGGSPRGWRLGKSKAADRVDPVISLAMAAIGIVQAGKPAGFDHNLQQRATSIFIQNAPSRRTSRV